MDPLMWEIKFYEIGMRQEVTPLELERFVDKQMRRHLMPRRMQLLLPLPKTEAETASDTE